MARKKHIIALSGFAGVGKDTVADLLVTHLSFRKMAFADALRAEVAEAFGIEIAYLSHPSTKNQPMHALAMCRAPLGFVGAVALAIGNEHRTADGLLADEWMDKPRAPRQILQWWGTEYRRRQQDRYWSRILVQRLTELSLHGEDRFVVTDCRFPNEADAIHELGGDIWQITRPGIDATTTAEGAHASAVDGSAFAPAAVVNNAHDIAHLQQLVLAEFFGREAGICSSQIKVTV